MEELGFSPGQEIYWCIEGEIGCGGGGGRGLQWAVLGRPFSLITGTTSWSSVTDIPIPQPEMPGR